MGIGWFSSAESLIEDNQEAEEAFGKRDKFSCEVFGQNLLFCINPVMFNQLAKSWFLV